jgi:hypothetical protein
MAIVATWLRRPVTSTVPPAGEAAEWLDGATGAWHSSSGLSHHRHNGSQSGCTGAARGTAERSHHRKVMNETPLFRMWQDPLESEVAPEQVRSARRAELLGWARWLLRLHAPGRPD